MSLLLTDSKLARQAPFCGTLPSMRSNSRRKLDERLFVEQVQECMNNGYLLSSKKIGSGAFSKVYLAYATRERMKHNPKLASDLRAKRHSMVREACHLLCGFLGGTPVWFWQACVLNPLRYLPATLASSMGPPS